MPRDMVLKNKVWTNISNPCLYTSLLLPRPPSIATISRTLSSNMRCSDVVSFSWGKIYRNRFCRYYFSLRWKTASIKTAVEWLGETCRHVQKMHVDGNAKKHIHVEKMMTKFDICLFSVTICQFLFPMLSAACRHESIKSISRNDELIWDVYAWYRLSF